MLMVEVIEEDKQRQDAKAGEQKLNGASECVLHCFHLSCVELQPKRRTTLELLPHRVCVAVLPSYS